MISRHKPIVAWAIFEKDGSISEIDGQKEIYRTREIASGSPFTGAVKKVVIKIVKN